MSVSRCNSPHSTYGNGYPDRGQEDLSLGITQYAHLPRRSSHTLYTHTCICTNKYMHVQPDGTHKPECWRYTHKPERGATHKTL